MARRKKGVINEIGRSPGSFAVSFFLMFVLAVVFLAAADALPEVPSARESVNNLFNRESQGQVVEVTQAEAPVRVVARAASVDVTISNPSSTAITALDSALLTGAVRYPSSGLLGQNGTVLLFGHSSSLPIVQNRNFKAFNGIQNLKQGNVISVYSGNHEYRYSVTGVRLANSTEDVVELPSNGKFLTLVTCNNSIANKTGRYVVTAEFVEAYPISN